MSFQQVHDVIAAFMDLQDALTRFTQGALTISGGIGLYHDKFPINVMAQEVEYLEEVSKDLDGKNAITLLSKEHCYSWPVFQNRVIEEKYVLVSGYFDSTQQYGMAFLYHLVELLRGTQEQINMQRRKEKIIDDFQRKCMNGVVRRKIAES